MGLATELMLLASIVHVAVYYGANLKPVIENARKSGEESPTIFYIPCQGQRHNEGYE